MLACGRNFTRKSFAKSLFKESSHTFHFSSPQRTCGSCVTTFMLTKILDLLNKSSVVPRIVPSRSVQQRNSQEIDQNCCDLQSSPLQPHARPRPGPTATQITTAINQQFVFLSATELIPINTQSILIKKPHNYLVTLKFILFTKSLSSRLEI